LKDTPKSARLIATGVRNGAEAERRRFTEEYKAETVRLIESSGQSIGKLALEWGIGETALRR
jgi:transposase-like protein